MNTTATNAATSADNDSLCWQPIKTAPKGIDVLVLAADGKMWVGATCDFETCDKLHYQTTSHDPNEIENATHWMPLPLPPNAGLNRLAGFSASPGLMNC